MRNELLDELEKIKYSSCMQIDLKKKRRKITMKNKSLKLNIFKKLHLREIRRGKMRLLLTHIH